MITIKKQRREEQLSKVKEALIIAAIAAIIAIPSGLFLYKITHQHINPKAPQTKQN